MLCSRCVVLVLPRTLYLRLSSRIEFRSTKIIMLLDTLRIELQNARRPAAGSNSKTFVPEGYLREHLTLNDITSLLSDTIFDIPQHKQESTAITVYEEALKILSILVDLNWQQKLSSFIEGNVLDSSLPLDDPPLRSLIPEAWTSFKALQWEYLAYRFRKGQYRIKLQQELILPYIEQTPLGEGGFSKVSKVLIHFAHQNLLPDVNRQVCGANHRQ